jgi:hypothetical protein
MTTFETCRRKSEAVEYVGKNSTPVKGEKLLVCVRMF